MQRFLSLTATTPVQVHTENMALAQMYNQMHQSQRPGLPAPMEITELELKLPLSQVVRQWPLILVAPILQTRATVAIHQVPS